ncbi:MAG: DEAD/DEAH box helicase [Gemmatimonadetes bacterium]|nr:DEAD/DEAH box helicase [Gemmatimonadota bacterium]
MTSGRPYQAHSSEQLAAAAEKATTSGDQATLAAIAHELSFRSTRRAKRLHQELTQGLALGRAAPPATGAVSDSGSNIPDKGLACPECGAPMMMRTARKGKNAGGQFWGCTTYPQCEGTRAVGQPDAREAQQTRPSQASPDTTSVRLEVPVVYVAEPVEAGYQVEAFESVALPQALVALINLGDIDPRVVRSFAGWRLDFPLPSARRPLGVDRTVVSLARDLLLRGATPIAFGEIEAGVEARCAPRWRELSASALAELLAIQAAHPPSPHSPGAFDSPEERELVNWIQGEIRKYSSGWSVQAQVHVESLAAGMPPASRADVLLTHPAGSRVVVELDGAGHGPHTDADRVFTEGLSRAGYEVIRVTTEMLRQRSGAPWGRLTELLGRPGSIPAITPEHLALTHHRLLHQLQVACLTAVISGHLPLRGSWAVQVPTAHGLSPELIRDAIGQVGEVLHRLSRLWAVEPIPRPDVQLEVLRLGRSVEGGPFELICPESAGRYFISDVVLPVRPLDLPAWAGQPSAAADLDSADGEWFLKWIFRKGAFWEGQWECISRALQGRDTLVLLPTGRGKSIAFQLAALLRPGPCLVVDPIISLMEDQMDNLRTTGLDRTLGFSSRQRVQERDELLSAFASGHYKFCFVSPERFQSIPFRETLRRLTVNSPISLIAIDEAHCVSEWGHDFRTAYLNLGRTTRDYCTRSGEPAPPLVGLTGTASRVVLKDVQRALVIRGVDAIVTPKDFDRPELTFGVVACRSDEKAARLSGLVQGMPQRFGLTHGSFYATGGGNGGGRTRVLPSRESAVWDAGRCPGAC